MYRKMITLLLCVSTVLAAPPKSSNITYVKRQAQVPELQQDQKYNSRESRIENLPLTIPGVAAIHDLDQKESKNVFKKVEVEQPNKPTHEPPLYNYSDRIYSIKTKPKKNNITTAKTVPVEVVNDSDINSSDIFPSESVHTDTIAQSENSTIKYEIGVTESDELVTEQYEEEPTITTEAEEETTKAPTARFLPKLSHYGKSSGASFSQNLIATSGKRRYRSRCRCEKIWNCAKLQISVPRCPEEYFMCCS